MNRAGPPDDSLARLRRLRRFKLETFEALTAKDRLAELSDVGLILMRPPSITQEILG